MSLPQPSSLDEEVTVLEDGAAAAHPPRQAHVPPPQRETIVIDDDDDDEYDDDDDDDDDDVQLVASGSPLRLGVSVVSNRRAAVAGAQATNTPSAPASTRSPLFKARRLDISQTTPNAAASAPSVLDSGTSAEPAVLQLKTASEYSEEIMPMLMPKATMRPFLTAAEMAAAQARQAKMAQREQDRASHARVLEQQAQKSRSMTDLNAAEHARARARRRRPSRICRAGPRHLPLPLENSLRQGIRDRSCVLPVILEADSLVSSQSLLEAQSAYLCLKDAQARFPPSAQTVGIPWNVSACDGINMESLSNEEELNLRIHGSELTQWAFVEHVLRRLLEPEFEEELTNLFQGRRKQRGRNSKAVAKLASAAMLGGGEEDATSAAADAGDDGSGRFNGIADANGEVGTGFVCGGRSASLHGCELVLEYIVSALETDMVLRREEPARDPAKGPCPLLTQSLLVDARSSFDLCQRLLHFLDDAIRQRRDRLVDLLQRLLGVAYLHHATRSQDKTALDAPFRSVFSALSFDQQRLFLQTTRVPTLVVRTLRDILDATYRGTPTLKGPVADFVEELCMVYLKPGGGQSMQAEEEEREEWEEEEDGGERDGGASAAGSDKPRQQWLVEQLHAAAASGDEALAVALLHRRVPVDARNEDGMTPLMVAAQHGHRRVATLLLDNFAQVDLCATAPGSTLDMSALDFALSHVSNRQTRQRIVKHMIARRPTLATIVQAKLYFANLDDDDVNMLGLLCSAEDQCEHDARMEHKEARTQGTATHAQIRNLVLYVSYLLLNAVKAKMIPMGALKVSDLDRFRRNLECMTPTPGLPVDCALMMAVLNGVAVSDE